MIAEMPVDLTAETTVVAQVSGGGGASARDFSHWFYNGGLSLPPFRN
jgi:hypothetical protein